MKKHGHVILKNTGIKEPKEFAEWGKLFIKSRDNYKSGTNPRDDLGEGILNVSTAEPPYIYIPFHNEMSYLNNIPTRICFCCFWNAPEGGITTLMDNVKMSMNLPQYIKDKVQRYGVNYVLNMQNLEAYKDGREEKWYSTW